MREITPESGGPVYDSLCSKMIPGSHCLRKKERFMRVALDARSRL